MRFRSQSGADLAIRVLFLGGIAMAITGIVIVREHGATAAVLLVVGVPLAAVGPCCISGPETGGDSSNERMRREGSERS